MQSQFMHANRCQCERYSTLQVQINDSINWIVYAYNMEWKTQKAEESVAIAILNVNEASEHKTYSNHITHLYAIHELYL